jgi:hypothetical protein
MTPQCRLHQLLCRLFDGSGLRRFVAHDPHADELAPELPGEVADLAGTASALIAAVQRRGLLDEAFFDRLCAERPRHAAEIDALRGELATGGPTDADASRFQLRLVFGRFRLMIMLGVACLVLAGALRLCPVPGVAGLEGALALNQGAVAFTEAGVVTPPNHLFAAPPIAAPRRRTSGGGCGLSLNVDARALRSLRWRSLSGAPKLWSALAGAGLPSRRRPTLCPGLWAHPALQRPDLARGLVSLSGDLRGVLR